MARKYISVGVVLLLASLLLAACGVPQADLDAAVTERDAAKAEVTSLQSQVSSLQSEYNQASSDLAAIQEVYPPRHFTSATELRQWLAANAISEMPATEMAETLVDRTLQLQEAALEDGYIISMNLQEDFDFFYITATALIGGLIWIVDVETDEVLQWSTLTAVR